MAALDIGRLVCGEGCRVVVAASKVRLVAVLCLVFPTPVAMLLYINRLADYCAATEKAHSSAFQLPFGPRLDVLAMQAPASKSLGAALQEGFRDRTVLGVLASFAVLVFLGEMAKMSSPAGKGCLISAVGGLGVDAMFCLLVLHTLTRMMWRPR
ncbi:hypothetical protein EJB05_49118, partial [Eragrostis curvula]